MEEFALKYGLKPGDRIITPRSGWRLIQHHAIYWGKDKGTHWIIENKDDIGVRFISLEIFLKNCIEIKEIKRFNGDEYQRIIALERAQSKLGHAYDLWNFNCEHFANFVQYGESFSSQVQNFSKGIKVAAGFIGAMVIINALTKDK